MINDITDFLPKYPNINNTNIDFLNPYEEDFYTAIFEKKEFYDEKLEKIESLPEKKGDLLRHQKIISRFMSSHTPYDRLLLVHAMGSGKSASAIGSIELIKSENSNYTGAVILARGTNLLNNFKNELVNEVTKGIYIPDNFQYLTQGERVARTNKLVREYYSFEFYDGKSAKDNTFYQFAQYLSTKSDEFIISNYSNKIIVIDEVHNIRIKDIEKGKEVYVYKEFHRFLHLIKNSKVLLLSGTPIKDTIDEFANIINLILPLDEQFPIKEEFINEYFDNIGAFYKVKPSKIQEIKNKLKGRVSYLKAVTSNVKKVFVGEKNIGKLKHFIVYKDIMSTFQSDKYKEVYEKDVDGKGVVYLDSRQASLFVFPDGTYGDAGFGKDKIKNDNNIIEKKTKVKGAKGKMVDKISYALSDTLKKKLKKSEDSTEEEILQNIKKYSSKYEACIRNILKAYRDKKSSFVYCEYIKGSSALLFSLLLNLFGFQKANGTEKTKGMRYVLLNNISSKNNEIKFLVDRFNKPDNLFGEYINIIIGSKVVSEGISFKNIQEEHILTPHWNYSETDQAIARGYRFGSHQALIEAGVNPELKVYQYVSIPNKIVNKKRQLEYDLSIDLRMYEISEIKDVNIKRIERIIKEASFDCGLTYERNYVSGYDGERECEYMKCNYSCDEINPELYKKEYTEYVDEEVEKEEEEEIEKEEENEEEEITFEDTIINELRSLGTYSIIVDKYENIKKIKKALKRSLEEKEMIDTDFNINEYTELIKKEIQKMSYEDDLETEQYQSSEEELEDETGEENKDEELNKIQLESEKENESEKEEIDYGEYCDGTENELILDKSTYQLYYNEKRINEFIRDIEEIYNKKYFKIDIDTIKNHFREYSFFEIITGLRKIINDNKIIKNKYGFPCYLKENNNIYFLVDNLTVDNNSYSEYYTQNPLIEIKNSFIKIINNIFIKESPRIIKYIFSLTDIKKIQETIYKLPIEIIEIILENSIIANEKDIKTKKIQRDMILEIFKNDYKKIEKEGNVIIISSLLYNTKNILKCLELQEIESGWKVCTQDYFKEYKTEIKKQKEKLVENQYGGYYGLYNRDLDIFCIKKPDIGLKNKTSGSVCDGPAWKVEDLIKLVVKIFKMPLPDKKIPDSEIKNNKKLHDELKNLNKEKLVDILKTNKNTKELYNEDELNSFEIDDLKRIYYWGKQQKKPTCKYLKSWLDKQNLIINDPTCGTSFKEIIEKEEKKPKEKKTKEKKSKKEKA